MQTADMKVKGAGGVLDPHLITKSFAEALPAGDITVKVLAVHDENPELASKYSAHWEVECEYPDGFIAFHQVEKTASPDALLDRIRNKLRGRHGLAHGNTAQEGQHGLAHVAGELVAPLPASVTALAGTSIVFKKVG